MKFLKTIGNSIHSPEFYSELAKKSFKQSFGYFFLLILLLTVIRVATLTNDLLIQAPKDVKNFVQETIDCYPNDLEIKVSNGQATSSATQEPYFVSCKDDPALLVIDTKTPYSPLKFTEYNADAWLTKDAIVYKQNTNETRSYSLQEVKDFQLNKQIISSFQAKYEPYLNFVGPILLLLAFVGIFLVFNFQLIHLVFIGFIVWLLSRAFNKNLSYPTSYKISMYAITLGLIIDLVVSITSRWTNFHGFPFMMTILTVSVVLVNLFLPKKKD